MHKNRRLIYGVGLNDADYAVTRFSRNKNGNLSSIIICGFYSKWQGMLNRCYSEASLKSRPSYYGSSVSDDWLTFSNFKKWMEHQRWQGMHLDKDIIVTGNKVYSSDCCAFVNGLTNGFVTDCNKSRGDLLIGVTWHKRSGKFKATCSNPFTKKNEYLGLFKAELCAHLAWRGRKHELACQLADLQTDMRVADALRVRYL